MGTSGIHIGRISAQISTASVTQGHGILVRIPKAVRLAYFITTFLYNYLTCRYMVRVTETIPYWATVLDNENTLSLLSTDQD